MSDVDIELVQPSQAALNQRRIGIGETFAALVGIGLYYGANRSPALSTFGVTGDAYALMVAAAAALATMLIAHRFGEFANGDRLTTFRAVGWTGAVLFVKHGLAFSLAWLDRSRLPECIESVQRGQLHILAMLGAAPLAEELLFRVLLQGGLTKVFPATVAVPVSAILYFLIHDQYPLWERSDILISGLLLGAAWHQTRSLGLVVLIHMAMNLISIGWPLFAHERLEIPLCR